MPRRRGTRSGSRGPSGGPSSSGGAAPSPGGSSAAPVKGKARRIIKAVLGTVFWIVVAIFLLRGYRDWKRDADAGKTVRPAQTEVIVHVDADSLTWIDYSIRTATVWEIPGLTVNPGDTLVFRCNYRSSADIGDMVRKFRPEWSTVYPDGIGMEAGKFFTLINHPGICPMPKKNAVSLLGAIGEMTRDQVLCYSVTGSYFFIGAGTEVVVPKDSGGKVFLRTNIPWKRPVMDPKLDPNKVAHTWWIAHGFWRVGYKVLPART